MIMYICWQMAVIKCNGIDDSWTVLVKLEIAMEVLNDTVHSVWSSHFIWHSMELPHCELWKLESNLIYLIRSFCSHTTIYHLFLSIVMWWIIALASVFRVLIAFGMHFRRFQEKHQHKIPFLIHENRHNCIALFDLIVWNKVYMKKITFWYLLIHQLSMLLSVVLLISYINRKWK